MSYAKLLVEIKRNFLQINKQKNGIERILEYLKEPKDRKYNRATAGKPLCTQASILHVDSCLSLQSYISHLYIFLDEST